MSPVLQRELNGSARDPALRWARAVAAAVAAIVFGSLVVFVAGPDTAKGARLFGILHASWLFALLLLGTVTTARSVARERIEGTFGLLLLTSLRPREVIVAKAWSHALRLASIWLAALPIGIVPVVLGSVSARNVVTAVAEESVVAFVALGTGLMASATVEDPRFALRQAVNLALVWGVVLAGTRTLEKLWFGQLPWISVQIFGFACWLVFAVVLGVASVAFAASRAESRWRADHDGGKPKRADTALNIGDAAEAIERAAWRVGPGRRIRARRPLLWLHLRRAGRIETRGYWVLVALLGWIVSVVAGNGMPSLVAGGAIVAAMCVVAGRGFHDERSEGAMELLLCVPGLAPRLMASRLGFVVRTFGWAVVFQAAMHVVVVPLFRSTGGLGLAGLSWVWASLAAVPAYGMLASARLRRPAASMAVTACIGLLPSLAAGWIARRLDWKEPWIAMTAVQAFLGAAAWWMTRRDFADRGFALRPVET